MRAANPFHRRGPSPGAHPNWDQRAFGEPRVPYALPDGTTGVVQPHRLYAGPRGITTAPYVATAQVPMIRKWLPSSTGVHSPPGAMAWVQLSTRFPHVGILHAPGLASRPVRVLERGTDARGGARALVTHRLSSAGEVARNPTRVVVATRDPALRVRVKPSSTRSLKCRVFPHSKGCAPARVVVSNPPARAKQSWGAILRQLLMGQETVHATAQGLEISRGR